MKTPATEGLPMRKISLLDNESDDWMRKIPPKSKAKRKKKAKGKKGPQRA